jgi:AcrR family transcriptional regulator
MNGSTTSLRARQRKHTEAEIVRAAFELFGKHGYDGVSVEMIASKAGISRATFFNYFPQKELILREVAVARAEKLKSFLMEASAGGNIPTLEVVVEVILKLCEENARITVRSKGLFVQTMFHQVSRGLLLAAREQAIAALAKIIERIPSHEKQGKLIAETLFAVYIATTLEWMMREGIEQDWLVDTMRERLLLVLKGAR